MRTITIDTTKDEYPKFLYKETENTDNGYLMCEVALSDGEDYKGRVISISTNGKYKVELLEEV
jgi:hypothetical protein